MEEEQASLIDVYVVMYRRVAERKARKVFNLNTHYSCAPNYLLLAIAFNSLSANLITLNVTRLLALQTVCCL